ncbi:MULTISPECIES: hypothetical protein [unclassified Chelatococcus]|uniref:hypothetical protein n=1 Tax=unclassified Chelatococcus TaxID=2638111 RepID=UPI001BCD3009|nr:MULTISPECIES: hypothetical protein [unclassified Chelatococcus]MBS7698036.1 hypothetical protein [Chelatococcus sp. YT9]MBX3556646.1 hypothetical protein [Chelatococcus sp.]
MELTGTETQRERLARLGRRLGLPMRHVSSASWRRFVVIFCIGSFGFLFGVLALMLLVDPFDTGRSPVRLKEGVPQQGPRTANVSRGRDQAFNSAIIGNSRVQMIDPAVLSEKTGIPFVALVVQGALPKELLTTWDWFMAHRAEPPKVMVLGIDGVWCSDDFSKQANPFPYWLYSLSTLDYLQGLFRSSSLSGLRNYFSYVIGQRPQAPPNGFWNYENVYGVGTPEQLAHMRQELDKPQGTADVNLGNDFPAAQAVAARIATLPADTKVVLVRPPVYITGMPEPGTPAAKAETVCRDIFAKIAAERPNTYIVDWRLDRPENRDPGNFFDHTHYRRSLAERLEAEIVAIIDGNRVAQP